MIKEDVEEMRRELVGSDEVWGWKMRKGSEEREYEEFLGGDV
ncbi:hypothetical protein [Zymomonas mobilis]